MEEGAAKLVGVFTTDSDLIIRLWDPTLERMTGRTARDVVGQPLVAAVPRVSEKRLLDRFERSLSEGTTEILAAALHGFLIPCPTLEPSEFFNEMRQNVKISPLRQDSKLTGLIVTVEDVTQTLDRKLALSAKLKHEQRAVRLEGAREISAETGPITRDTAGPVISALADEDWRVRRRLVDAMGRRAAPDAIDALFAALKQRHLDFATVNSALQVLRSTSVEVVEPLIGLLSSSETDLRMHAALALGELGDDSAVPTLLRTLADPDVNVRYHAIEALGKLKAESAVSRLVEIAEQRDFFLSFVALEALASIGAVTEGDRIAKLVNDEVLWEPASRALAGSGDIRHLARIIELLDRDHVPVTVVAELYNLLQGRTGRWSGTGSEAGRSYEVGLLSPAGKERLLTALRTARKNEIDQLVNFASRFPDEDVAAALVERLDDSELEDLVVRALLRQEKAAVKSLVSKLGSPNPHVRTLAVRLLGDICDERAVPGLLNVINNDEHAAPETALALGRIGGEAFGHLLHLVESGDAVKRAAAKGLALLSDPSYEPRLAELLNDPDAMVRCAVVEAFGNIGSPRSVEVLIESCDDPDESVRKAAVKSLAAADGPQAEERLIFSLRHDTPLVRAAAAGSLGAIRTEASRDALVEALGDPDSWTRYFSLRSLARFRDRSLADRINRVAKSDTAEHVRMAAMDVLNELGM